MIGPPGNSLTQICEVTNQSELTNRAKTHQQRDVTILSSADGVIIDQRISSRRAEAARKVSGEYQPAGLAHCRGPASYGSDAS